VQTVAELAERLRYQGCIQRSSQLSNLHHTIMMHVGRRGKHYNFIGSQLGHTKTEDDSEMTRSLIHRNRETDRDND